MVFLIAIIFTLCYDIQKDSLGGDSMRFYIMSHKRFNFVITPDELREILKEFHHVVVNTGVKKNYIESDPEEFFLLYEALYAKLKNGDRLVWQDDWKIATLATGITQHLDNCRYVATTRKSVPDFLEPCPFLEAFCIVPYKEKLSTAFSVLHFAEYICGLSLFFPNKVEFLTTTRKHPQGIVMGSALDDYISYQKLVSAIRKITKPLTLQFNGRTCRPTIRISDKAKKDFCNFYLVKNENITVL